MRYKSEHSKSNVRKRAGNRPKVNTDFSDVDEALEKKKKVSGGKQHPASVGHHGTDKEKDLNPEE